MNDSFGLRPGIVIFRDDSFDFRALILDLSVVMVHCLAHSTNCFKHLVFIRSGLASGFGGELG